MDVIVARGAMVAVGLGVCDGRGVAVSRADVVGVGVASSGTGVFVGAGGEVAVGRGG